MATGDAHARSMVPRDLVAMLEAAGRPSTREVHLGWYLRYVRTLSPVALLAVAAIIAFVGPHALPSATAAWLVGIYVAGVAYQAVVLASRLPRITVFRASLVVDTLLVGGAIASLGAPELATAAYLWPLLAAAHFLAAREVVAVTSFGALVALGVALQAGDGAGSHVPWVVLLVVALVGAVLAISTSHARRAERELGRERLLEDVVLRFTERARTTSLDGALRELELDIRTSFGASHVWIDLSRDERTTRSMPGGVSIPVTWDGQVVARIAVARSGGGSVDAGLVRSLERMATFVGAVVGQVDAVERRDEATARLRDADLLKDRFLAMASHELRTPLTSIRGFSETISRQWDILADEDKLRFLAIVVAQSERLAKLVEDLLMLSGIQSGRFAVQAGPVPVGHAVESAVRRLGPADVSIDCEARVVAHADPDHVATMLDNLLENAVQYGDSPISVTCEQVGPDVTIAVADTGPGVSPEFEPRLFAEFQRDRATAGTHGTGLGLSIVRTLARAHGGEAWHEPNEPGGARFLVRLPALAGGAVSGASRGAAGREA